MSTVRERAWVRLSGRLKGPRAWRKDIGEVSPGLSAGDVVAVLGDQDVVLGWGIFHPSSQIAVRLVRRGEEPFDEAWLRDRAAAAARARLAHPSIEGVAYRVLHAEGDGFPALVMDRFDDVLVAELYTSAALPLFEAALPVLHEELGTKHHMASLDDSAAQAERSRKWSERSPDCPDRVQFEEGGLRYEIDLRHGHKTGFFCDQRENRARVGAHARHARVLDVCCYTGGFALAAAQGGAQEVLGVDLDERALALAKRNANLNGLRARFTQADAFSFLRTLGQNERRFDLVVLDPPKFVPNRREYDTGIAKYHDMNKLALPLVEPGGLLVSCSCSGIVSAIELQETVRRAARPLGRAVQVERVTGAGPDHPVALDFPEGAYLKTLWLRVT